MSTDLDAPARTDYQLTPHCILRVRERSHLSPQAILDLLNQGMAVEGPGEPGGEYVGLVFWSQQDETAYLAVVYRKSGEVITVMPARREDGANVMVYARRRGALVWRAWVKNKHIRQAMAAAGVPPPPEPESPAQRAARPYEIVARYLAGDGRQRVKKLGKLSADIDPDEADLAQAADSASRLAADTGAVGLVIEVRQPGSVTPVREWVLSEPIAYRL